MHRRHLALALSLVLSAGLSVACTSGEDEMDQGEDAYSSAANKPPLDDATKRALLTTATGSEFLPYALVRALEVQKPGGREGETVRFLSDENLKAMRFVADPSVPGVDGLPVGMTVGVAKDTGFVSVGFNCAACHVGEVRYQAGGQQRRVLTYGGVNPVDFTEFFTKVNEAISENVKDLGFYARLVRESRHVERALPEIHDQIPDGTLDRVGFMYRLAKFMALGNQTPEEFVADLDLPEERRRLVLARVYYLRATRSPNGGPITSAGPGRASPNAAGKKLMFGHHGYVVNDKGGPVSSSGLFNIETSAWFHSHANTNSTFARNFFQAFAVGGVIDMYGPEATYGTSVKIDSVRALEYAFYKVAPPAWPADAPRDAAKAARGQQVYVAKCAGCHEPKVERDLYVSKLVPADVVGTDRNYAAEYEDVVETPEGRIKMSDLMEKVVSRVKAKHYAEGGVSRAHQLVQEDVYDAALNPRGRRSAPDYRSTLAYQARPLDGVWATAPFLHNGSVPTLEALLSPEKRPAKFYVGHSEFDMVKVGILPLDRPRPEIGATFLLDTALPGNSNRGHEGPDYGTTLPADDKVALIEFLKGFGAGKARPVRFAR